MPRCLFWADAVQATSVIGVCHDGSFEPVHSVIVWGLRGVRAGDFGVRDDRQRAPRRLLSYTNERLPRLRDTTWR
jgi:hypothetical protein